MANKETKEKEQPLVTSEDTKAPTLSKIAEDARPLTVDELIGSVFVGVLDNPVQLNALLGNIHEYYNAQLKSKDYARELIDKADLMYKCAERVRQEIYVMVSSDL